MELLCEYHISDTKGNVLAVYQVPDTHRKVGNSNKSIWIVSPEVEFKCFEFTFRNDWVVNNEAWGFLLLSNGHFMELGKGTSGEILKIAKFRKSTTAVEWHGYPCNYMTKTQDVPADSVLKKWVEKGVITKAKMSKIQQTLVCNL